jgi:hypothetical protein
VEAVPPTRSGNIEEAEQGYPDDLARDGVLCVGASLHSLPKIGSSRTGTTSEGALPSIGRARRRDLSSSTS